MDLSAAAATLAVFLFPAAMIYAGIMDVMTLKIRNGLVAAIAVGYFVLAPLVGFTAEEIAWSVALAAGVLVVTFSFFALGWIGGGDAKLAAASALWFGPEHAFTYFMVTALIGGVLSVVVLWMRVSTLPASFHGYEWIMRIRESARGIPYGAAMAPAALIVLPGTDWIARAVA